MKKKITCLLLAISILATVWIPTAFAAGETTKVDPVVTTTIPVTAYSDYNLTARVYDTYASIGPNYWVEYVINVKETKQYDIYTWCASQQSSAANIRYTIDGALVGTAKIIKTAGGWYDFSKSVYVGSPVIEAGTHVLRITGGGVSIHYNQTTLVPVFDKSEMNDFTKKEGAYKEAYLPTSIEGENFDIGPAGHYSVDGDNSTKSYRKEDEIDILPVGDDENYAVALDVGEWTKYTFNADYAGVYKLGITCGGTADFSLYLDDSKNPIRYSVAEKLYYDTYPLYVYLDAGVHTIKLQCDKWIFNSEETKLKIDKINLTSGDVSKEDAISVSDLDTAPYTAPSAEEPDYDTLKEENNVYKNIYVSENGSDSGDGSKANPFKTMQRAVDEVAKYTDSMTGDIVVNFDSGVHYIDKTISLSNEHGGKNGYNVIFKGASEEKPVLSGGIEVTGWEKHDEYLWKAPLDGVTEVRNLYINDYPATRAKSKYYYTVEKIYNVEGDDSARGQGFVTSAVNFPKFEHPEDLETLWPAAWLMSFYPVDDVIYTEDNKAIFMMDQTAWKTNGGTGYGADPGSNFYLENAMELLNEPGEFYYNKEEKMIYYYPYEAEDMTTATTYAGQTELMFDVRGESKDSRIKNVIFDNLAVKYGAWHHVSNHGIRVRQADDARDMSTYPATEKVMSPGQLTVNNAENFVVKDCEFVCLGSTAMQFNDSVSNVLVEGNLIHDVSGTGIIVGSPYHMTETDRSNWLLSELGVDPCKNFMIRDNVIVRSADEYYFQTGMSIYYAANVNVIRNHIDQVPYTAITAGWGWETASMRSIYHKNIKLYNNYFGKTMQYLKDGGSLYTLGNLGGMEVAYNHFANYAGRGHGVGGLYNDAGSQNYVAHHNVIEPRVSALGNWLHSQKGYDVGYSRYYSNYATTQNHDSDGKNFIEVELPYLLGDDTTTYPQEALDIMANAGPADEYKSLIAKAQLPEWKKWRVKTSPDLLFKSATTVEAKYGWIQAEDFIPGNNGETYYDLTGSELNNTYRAEDVELLDTSSRTFTGEGTTGYIIQIITDGEWMTYKAKVPEDGYYKFKMRYGCANATQIDLYIDNKLVIDNGAVPASGGWYHTYDHEFDGIYLEAGEHTLRYVFAKGGQFLDQLGLFPQDGELAEEETEEVVLTAAPDYDECVMKAEEPPKAEEPTFQDIAGHYAKSDILTMLSAKMVKGYDPYTFGPDDALTREQAALIVMRAGRLAFDEANWQDGALEYGLITERGNEKAIITREEFAHFIMCVYKQIAVNYKVTLGNDYKDNSEISEKFYLDVLAAREVGLMKGDTNGNFRPKDGLTRAEAAVAGKRIAFN